MNNQFGFSSGLGTGFNQPFTGKTVNDTINNIDKWQAETKQKYSNEKTVAMENSAKNMYECAMRTNDGQVRKQNLSGANLSNMEIIIKQAAQEHGSTAYDDLGEGQILCRFMQKNPQYEQITNGTLGGDVNLKTWARVIGANTTITKPKETGWQKAADVAVGIAQSPGKRGYNMVGQWIDRAGKALADKLQGTELADFIQQSAIDLFGEDEVKAFAEQRQKELAEGTAFDGREQTDIRTPLLGEERANNGYTRAGEVIGDIGTAIALSYPMMSATTPIMANSTLLGKTILGASEGALDMAAYDYGTTGEAPTPGSMAMGAALGGAAPILGAGYKSVKPLVKDVVKKSVPNAERTLMSITNLSKGARNKFAKDFGMSEGKYLNDRGINGTFEEIINKVSDYRKANMADVDKGLATIKGRYKNDYFNEMIDDVVSYAERNSFPKDEVAKFKKIQELAHSKGVTMSEVNDVKRFYERNNKFTYGKDMTAAEKTVKATNIDNGTRERQMKIADENGFTNLRQMNKETQMATDLLNKYGKNLDEKFGNPEFGLSDYLLMGTLSPKAFVVTGIKKFLESPTFKKNYVNLYNKLTDHKVMDRLTADFGKIQNIQDIKGYEQWLKDIDYLAEVEKKELDEIMQSYGLKFEALPYQENVVKSVTPNVLPSGSRGIKVTPGGTSYHEGLTEAVEIK